jgi:hypothetical protein
MAFICPEYEKSRYCMLEFEYFIECHGVERVIPIITEGKTTEIIPDSQLPINSMDVRQDPLLIIIENEYEGSKHLKDEKLRNRLSIIARIIDSKLDQLYDRFHRQRMANLRKRAALIVAVVLLFLAGAVFAYKQIEKQRNTAVLNEMHLLIERSNIETTNGYRFGGLRYALDSYEIYKALFKSGNDNELSKIRQALDYSLYSQSWQLLSPLKNQNRHVSEPIYSPDDKYILAKLGAYDVGLFSAFSGELLQVYTFNRKYVSDFSFSPSGEYFVTAFYGGKATVYKTNDIPEIIDELEQTVNDLADIETVEFLSDTELLIAFQNDEYENQSVIKLIILDYTI